MTEIKPTRMGLLYTEKRLSLADKGYDLLKRKYDALMMRFNKQLKNVKRLRKELHEQYSSVGRQLHVAEVTRGFGAVEEEVKANQGHLTVTCDTAKDFGVEYPVIRVDGQASGVEGDSPQVKLIRSRMDTSREKLVELVNAQLALVRIAAEIERTKKKVNSLEKRIIPDLKTTKRRISFVLEEQERELFTTLKIIKDRRKEGSGDGKE